MQQLGYYISNLAKVTSTTLNNYAFYLWKVNNIVVLTGVFHFGVDSGIIIPVGYRSNTNVRFTYLNGNGTIYGANEENPGVVSFHNAPSTGYAYINVAWVVS